MIDRPQHKIPMSTKVNVEVKETHHKLCTGKMKNILKGLLGLVLIAGIGSVVIISRKKLKMNIFQTTGKKILISDGGMVITRNKKSSVDVESTLPWKNIRLPRSIIPDSYFLNLYVDMERENYAGIVNIKANITKSTRYILLHKADINVDKIRVMGQDGNRLMTQGVMEYQPNEYLVIIMASDLQVGTQITIVSSFKAPLRTDFNGFFIWKRKGGQSKMAYTFLSPISARKFFPCFDEPSFKAKFRIMVTNDAKYNALSNMASLRRTTKHNLTTTEFKESLPMSTYTLGLLLADNSYISYNVTTNSKYQIKLWAFKDQMNYQKQFLQELIDLLKYNEKIFFEIPFPLEKLDIAVIPAYSPGAMESWGLMLFRKFSSYGLRAHEVVHQWFGNLATMEFWDEAWIKEGFAQYLATVIGDKLKKSEKLKEQFFAKMSNALPMDSYASSHAMVPEIKTPTDIRNVYDNLVYYKGEPVVHILSTYVGENNFRIGMKKFLEMYKYKNAKQDDLFQVMSDICGKNVKAFMDPWLLQLGYPLLKIKRINSTHIEAEQERFSLDAPNTVIKPSPFNYQWPIILTYRFFNQTQNHQTIMKNKKEILKVPENTILNPDHMQYYRIRYHKIMRVQLKSQLIKNRQNFTNQDVCGIISDQLYCLQARKQTLEETMDFVSILKNEKEHEPWIEASKIWIKVHKLLSTNRSFQKLWDSHVAIPYVNEAYRKFPSSSKLFQIACNFNNSLAVYYGRQLSGLTINEYSCCALQHDQSKDQKLWNYYHDKYLENPKANVGQLRYLACTMNTTQIWRVLNYTMSLDHTDASDATYYMSGMMHNDVIRDIAWTFIQRHWPEYFSRYRYDLFLLKELISGVVPLFRTEKELKQVETFYNSIQQSLGTGKQAFQQAISEIKMNIELTKFLHKEINKNGNTLRNPFINFGR